MSLVAPLLVSAESQLGVVLVHPLLSFLVPHIISGFCCNLRQVLPMFPSLQLRLSSMLPFPLHSIRVIYNCRSLTLRSVCTVILSDLRSLLIENAHDERDFFSLVEIGLCRKSSHGGSS